MSSIGNWMSSLFYDVIGRKSVPLMMLGLDCGGKTTIMYKLKLGYTVNVNTIPTVYFNTDSVDFKNIRFEVWDSGFGQHRIKPEWSEYFRRARCLVYVVDSGDIKRIMETRDELHAFLEADELRDIPLLVFANKQDLPNAMTVSELTGELGLRTLRQREWHIQPSCATRGEGLHEGMEWLVKNLK